MDPRLALTAAILGAAWFCYPLVGVLLTCFYLFGASGDGVGFVRRSINALLVLVLWPFGAIAVAAHAALRGMRAPRGPAPSTATLR